jgi:hypothetical protein
MIVEQGQNPPFRRGLCVGGAGEGARNYLFDRLGGLSQQPAVSRSVGGRCGIPLAGTSAGIEPSELSEDLTIQPLAVTNRLIVCLGRPAVWESSKFTERKLNNRRILARTVTRARPRVGGQQPNHSVARRGRHKLLFLAFLKFGCLTDQITEVQ